MNTKVSLQSSCSDDIEPSDITLKYIRPPDFFEVFIGSAEKYFRLELISEGQSIWKVTLRRGAEYGNSEEVAHGHEIQLARSGQSEEVTHRKRSCPGTDVRLFGQPSKMTSKSNQGISMLYFTELAEYRQRKRFKSKVNPEM